MSQTISVRIAHRDRQHTANQRRHDLRTGHLPTHVDQDRMQDNSLLLAPPMEAELGRVCAERRAQVPRKRNRKNPSISTVGVITFGRQAQAIVGRLPILEQDRLFRETAERIARRLGTTLSGLMVHRDESAIHAHFQCPAVRMDGQMVGASTTRKTTAELQDLAGEVWAHLGIRRGKPKKERIAEGQPAAHHIHRSVRELHQDLPAELEKARSTLEDYTRQLEETLHNLEVGRSEEERQEKRLEAVRKTLQETPPPEPVPMERVTERQKKELAALKDRLALEQQHHRDRQKYILELEQGLREVGAKIATLPEATAGEMVDAMFPSGPCRSVLQEALEQEQEIRLFNQQRHQQGRGLEPEQETRQGPDS